MKPWLLFHSFSFLFRLKRVHIIVNGCMQVVENHQLEYNCIRRDVTIPYCPFSFDNQTSHHGEEFSGETLSRVVLNYKGFGNAHHNNEKYHVSTWICRSGVDQCRLRYTYILLPNYSIAVFYHRTIRYGYLVAIEHFYMPIKHPGQSPKWTYLHEKTIGIIQCDRMITCAINTDHRYLEMTKTSPFDIIWIRGQMKIVKIKYFIFYCAVFTSARSISIASSEFKAPGQDSE